MTKQAIFGALCGSLDEQGFDDDDGRLQQDADAITRLHVRGLLTESAVHSARKKLAKQLLPKRSAAQSSKRK